MIDVAAILQAYLSYYWLGDSPSSTDIVFRFDEIDPRSPVCQLLLENSLNNKTWVKQDLQKTEHQVNLTMVVKPIRYDNETIENTKAVFFRARSEIERILNHMKFTIVEFRNIVMSNWNDRETVRRGFGVKGESFDKDPIFRSIMTVTVTYYTDTSSLDGSELSIRDFSYIFMPTLNTIGTADGYLTLG